MTASVTVQVVLFDNTLAELRRLAAGVGATIRDARATGTVGDVDVSFGDSSSTPVLCAADVELLGSALPADVSVTSAFFGENLGSGGGSNRLMDTAETDLVWVLNPDTVPAPSSLARLVDAVRPDDVAAVDARQIPIENPKGFDRVTGDASWVSGACMLLQRTAAAAVDGFDPHFFPMYCDDVDLSWRLRLAGGRVRHVPEAVVFHDKRLGADARPVASEFEHESGVLSRLFLAHRYGRPDVVDATLGWVDDRGSDAHRRAAAAYRARLADGDVPAPLDDPTGVADLDSDYYGPGRFTY